MSLHKLLKKQITKYLPEELAGEPGMEKLLHAINDSYIAFERDRELAERAFRISEEEYIEINEKLKHEIAVKQESVKKLRETAGVIKEMKIPAPAMTC